MPRLLNIPNCPQVVLQNSLNPLKPAKQSVILQSRFRPSSQSPCSWDKARTCPGRPLGRTQGRPQNHLCHMLPFERRSTTLPCRCKWAAGRARRGSRACPRRQRISRLCAVQAAGSPQSPADLKFTLRKSKRLVALRKQLLGGEKHLSELWKERDLVGRPATH